MGGVAKQDVKSEGASTPRHSEEFKRDAVRLVTEQQYTFAAAAKADGLSPQNAEMMGCLRVQRSNLNSNNNTCPTM